MSKIKNDVRLTIAGKPYGGWKSVYIARSIERLAGTFSLTASERWPDQPTRRPINPGDSCNLSIDGETVITGHVDDVNPSFDSETRQIAVAGRDITGDLVDCSATYHESVPSQYNNSDLLKIAKVICRPFGINVRTKTSVGETFQTFAIDPGETAFSAISRMARHRGVLVTSDGQGGLMVVRRGMSRAAVQLKEGINLLTGDATRSLRDRYSHYRALGQIAGTDHHYGEHAAAPVAYTKDTGVSRYRPHDVMAMSQAHHLKTLAEWEKNHRIGKSATAKVTVAGWRAKDDLWQPNTLVHLHSPSLGIDRDMLIVSVINKLDEQGTRTDLTLSRPEAYDLLPVPEKQDEWTSDWEFEGVL